MGVFRSLMMRGGGGGGVIYDGKANIKEYLSVPLNVGDTFTTELEIIKDVVYSGEITVCFDMGVGVLKSSKPIRLSIVSSYITGARFYLYNNQICTFGAKPAELAAGSVLKFTLDVINVEGISVSLWVDDVLKAQNKRLAINEGDMLYYISCDNNYIGNVKITRD